MAACAEVYQGRDSWRDSGARGAAYCVCVAGCVCAWEFEDGSWDSGCDCELSDGWDLGWGFVDWTCDRFRVCRLLWG